VSNFNVLEKQSTQYIIEAITRGVQYVHCVMHKCIMVKVGGKRNTRKVCKNTPI